MQIAEKIKYYKSITTILQIYYKYIKSIDFLRRNDKIIRN